MTTASRTATVDHHPAADRHRAAVRAALVLIVFTFLTFAPRAAHATPITPSTPASTEAGPERASAMVRPATVRLVIQWAGVVDAGDAGRFPVEATTTCTGFAVESSGYVVTAGHCIDPSPVRGGGDLLMQQLVARLAPQLRGVSAQELYAHARQHWTVEGPVAGSDIERSVVVARPRPAGQDPAVLQARVIDFRSFDDGDVALVKTENALLPTVPLAPAGSVRVGQGVLSVGFPGSVDPVTDDFLQATFKDGRISATRTRNGVPFYEISAALSQGMSGGPTVDHQGAVIGLNSFLPAREAQQFNFIASVSLIHDLLQRNGVTAGPSRLDELWTRAWDLQAAGQPRQALEVVDQVLSMDPDHLPAHELRVALSRQVADQPADDAPTGGADAVADGAFAPDFAAAASDGVPVLPLAAVAALAGAVVLALIKHRRDGQSPSEGAGPVFAPVPASPSPAGPARTAAAPSAVAAPPAPSQAWYRETVETTGALICGSCGFENRIVARDCVRCGEQVSR